MSTADEQGRRKAPRINPRAADASAVRQIVVNNDMRNFPIEIPTAAVIHNSCSRDTGGHEGCKLMLIVIIR